MEFRKIGGKKPTKSSVLQVFKTRPGPPLPPPVVVNSVVYKSSGKAGYWPTVREFLDKKMKLIFQEEHVDLFGL